MLQNILSGENLEVLVCKTIQDIGNGIQEGAGAAVIAGETLTMESQSGMEAALDSQPEWSDFPLIIMSTYDQKSGAVWKSFNRKLLTAHIVVLERPVHTQTLINAVRSALQSRRRQYQIRDELKKRRKTERVLRQSEERLRLAADAAGFGTYDGDLKAGTLHWSPEAKTILGINEEIQKPPGRVPDFIHPHDAQKVEEMMARAYDPAGSGEIVHEHRIVRPAGDVRWIHVRGQVRFENTGAERRAVRSTGIIIDITDRKQAEIALQESEKRFRSLADGTPVMMWMHDAEGNIEFVNQAYLDFFAVTMDKLWETGWQPRVHPHDIYDYESAFMDSLHKQKTFHSTARVRRKDGQWRWIESFGQPRFAPNGRFLGMAGSSPDITNRKLAEDYLLESRSILEDEVRERTAELNQIFQTTGSGLRVVDKNCTILRVNQTLLRMLDMTEEEVVGRKCHEILKSDQCGTPECPLQRVMKGEKRYMTETEKVREDGSTLYCLMTATPFTDPEGRIIGMIQDIVDITDQKQLESRFREAQKMESVGRLAAGIAHDFNNMIQVIQGWSDRLLRKTDDNDPAREGISIINKTGERAADLTRQLLAFGRKQVLDMKDIDLGRTIGEMIPMISRLLSEEIDINFQPPDGPVHVKADQSQLEQVLMNLAVNARDAMPKGGRLVIRLNCIHPKESLLPDYPPDMSGPLAELLVQDTGRGMDRETMARIFDPFFTTKKPGQGTGLGLSTIYGIIKQSGGEITVNSEPEIGTTFRIFLPMLQLQKETSAEPHSAVEAESSGMQGTLLFVEDEEMVREILADELEEFGLTVIQAGDFDHALEAARNSKKEIDLIVTDVVLKGRDGIETAAAVREVYPQAGVLYMSGYSEDHVEMRSTIKGGEFIQKPFTINELAPKIQEMLGSAKHRQCSQE